MHYAGISSFLPTATNKALHQQNPLQALSEDAPQEGSIHSFLYIFFILLSRGK